MSSAKSSQTNKKICLSISSFHPETWQPSWGIRTALLALMAFFTTEVSDGSLFLVVDAVLILVSNLDRLVER